MADQDLQPEATEPTPWAAIAGVIATVSVFAIAQGLSYPLLSFILQRQGVLAEPDRPVGRDDAARLHRLVAGHPGARAPLRRGTGWR